MARKAIDLGESHCLKNPIPKTILNPLALPKSRMLNEKHRTKDRNHVVEHKNGLTLVINKTGTLLKDSPKAGSRLPSLLE